MPNRLAAEKSPYLRQHAQNPVDWFPWGDEAFARARAEGKPVFLSIGYSTCHWCHVMAQESFGDAGIAAALNCDFVSVKLDREERPDLDRVYMAFVQQTTGHGGWPMSVWLTPDGKPFHGGTYFPPDDRHGRPGFLSLLNLIARHWREQRPGIEAGAEQAVQALRRYAAEGPARELRAEGAPAPLEETLGTAIGRGFDYFHEAHDPRWGGFGGAPKFPRASVIDFLLRTAAHRGAGSEAGAEAVKMAAHTLRCMAEGGIHDHLGGGFHRYSVDERWHVPHFEKMLYDQALVAMNFLEARQATGVEAYAWVARDIFAYVRRDLTGPHGGFHSAEDADSATADGRHAEGAFYVWTKAEIEAALAADTVGRVPPPGEAPFPRGEGTPPASAGSDAAFFCAHFGVREGGNVEHDPHGEFGGRNVLMQQRPLAESAREAGLTLEEAVEKLLACRKRLLAARERRPRPGRDDKVITAWNGLMISALARGAQVLERAARRDDSPCLRAATRAAEFLRAELWDEAGGLLFRAWCDGRGAIPGFAEDYAYLIQGLLDLYEAGSDIRWLEWAVRLQERMDGLFWDAENGGYFNSRADDTAVIVRLKEDYDGAEPAPGSVAVMNLMRLDWMLGLPGARDKAVRTVEALRGQWSRAPQALPQLLCAAELLLSEPRTVVLAGDPEKEDLRALAGVLHEKLRVRRAILCADGGAGQEWLARYRPEIASQSPCAGRAAAYLCEGKICRAPVSAPEDMRRALA